MHNFTVQHNDLSFKACDHPFKLIVSGATSVRHVQMPDIPFQTFTFKPFSEILDGNYREDLLVGMTTFQFHASLFNLF